jgi:hypothetical protein
MSAAAEYYGYLLAQGYGEHQLNEFADYARRADRGEISHNQAYRLACKSGFGKQEYSNMTQQQAQDRCEDVYESDGAEAFNTCVENKMSKKGFGDWMQAAQEAGWIDKGLGLLGGFLNKDKTNTGGYVGGGYVPQPPPPKSKAPLFIIGGIAVIGIGIAIYFAVKKK